MRWIVVILGVLVIGLGGIGVLQPARLIATTRALWLSPTGLYTAIALRVVLGTALLMVAPSSRFPDLFYVFGVVTLAAAAGVLVFGVDRLRAFVEWWVARPPMLIRIWALVAIGFGAFLVYGVR